MLCAVYKSKRKPGAYLYVTKRDDFDRLPEDLMASFGPPQFVMLFNLNGKKSLANVSKEAVLEKIQTTGFYLQLPKQYDGLFTSLSEIK